MAREVDAVTRLFSASGGEGAAGGVVIATDSEALTVEAAREAFDRADQDWRAATNTLGPGSSQRCYEAHALREEKLLWLLAAAHAAGRAEALEEAAQAVVIKTHSRGCGCALCQSGRWARVRIRTISHPKPAGGK